MEDFKMNYSNYSNYNYQPQQAIVNYENNYYNSINNKTSPNNNFQNNNYNLSNSYQNNMNYQNTNMSGNYQNNMNYQQYNNNQNNNVTNNSYNLSNSYQNNMNYQNTNNSIYNLNYQNTNMSRSYQNNMNYQQYSNNNQNNNYNMNNNYNNNMSYQNSNNNINTNNMQTNNELYNMMVEDYKNLFPGTPLNNNTIQDMMYDYMLIENIVKDLERSNPENVFKLNNQTYFHWKQLPLEKQLIFKINYFEAIVGKYLNDALMKYPNNRLLLDINATYTGESKAQKDYNYCYYAFIYGFNTKGSLYTQIMNYVMLYSYLRLLCEGRFVKKYLNLEQNVMNNNRVDLAKLLFANEDLDNRNTRIDKTATLGKQYIRIGEQIQNLTTCLYSLSIKLNIKKINMERENNMYNQQQINNQNYNYNNQQNMNNNYIQNFNKVQNLPPKPRYQTFKSHEELNKEAQNILSNTTSKKIQCDSDAKLENKARITKYFEKCLELINEIEKDPEQNLTIYEKGNIRTKINQLSLNYDYKNNEKYKDDDSNYGNPYFIKEMIKIFILLEFFKKSEDPKAKCKILEELSKMDNFNQINFELPFDHLSEETKTIVSNILTYYIK